MSRLSKADGNFPWDDLDAVGPVVVLVRHGRTSWNAEGRFLGRTDIGLDADGMAAAARLGSRIGGRFARVVSSPLSRASETARFLLSPEQDLELHGGLVEIAQGALEGLKTSEGLARYPEFFARWASDPADAHVPGGGESLGQVARRGLSALTELASGRGPIAVVSHQMVIAATCASLEGRALREYREFTMPNLGMAVLAPRDGALRVAAHGVLV